MITEWDEPENPQYPEDDGFSKWPAPVWLVLIIILSIIGFVLDFWVGLLVLVGGILLLVWEVEKTIK